MDPATLRFGALLREFRVLRGLSQADLSERAEVSTRHLSFLENARAAPSREMVLVLGSALDITLRDRNRLLGAAGFAPVYAESGDEQDGPLRRLLQRLIRAQEPIPAIVLNREWDVVDLNAPAAALLTWLTEGLDAPPEYLGNLLTAFLHPEGLRRRTLNWHVAAPLLVERARRECEYELDQGLRDRIHQRIAVVGELPAFAVPPEGRPVLPVVLERDGVRLSLLTTVTSLGSPIDVTAQAYRIESYLPEDRSSEDQLARICQLPTA